MGFLESQSICVQCSMSLTQFWIKSNPLNNLFTQSQIGMGGKTKRWWVWNFAMRQSLLCNKYGRSPRTTAASNRLRFRWNWLVRRASCFNLKYLLQEALIERLGKNSIPFQIEIVSITPPSVQLLPAKRYTGAPIGTSYDIRVYTGN